MDARIRNGLLAGAALVALTSVYAVVQGVSPGPEAAQGHVQVGSPAPGSFKVLFEANLEAPMLALMGADAGGFPVHAVGYLCSPVVDGGADPGAYTVPGAYIVDSQPTEIACVQGDSALEVWVQGRPDAPWLCACSSGTNCLWTSIDVWGTPMTDNAPLGRTLTEATWAGDGCDPKPCVDMLGQSSWPSTCPLR